MNRLGPKVGGVERRVISSERGVVASEVRVRRDYHDLDDPEAEGNGGGSCSFDDPESDLGTVAAPLMTFSSS